jgi:3-oxoacyl-[acyl-carrier protein] reductase
LYSVNNAGIMGMTTFTNVDEATFDAHFAINTKAPFFLTQLVVSHMPPGGRIILFSSSLTFASVVSPPYVTYVGSKGAVEQFARVLCKELAPKSITVNTVSPGPVDTPLFRNGKTEAMLDALRNLNPHKRFASVNDIKGVVNFLCGPEAAWVTGQNIRINGGFAV